MQADGLPTSREQVTGGRVRRLYTATTAGRRELSVCRTALRELAEEVLSERD